MVTICLWRKGYAATDPGFVFAGRGHVFDPNVEHRDWVVYTLHRAIKGACDRQCQVHGGAGSGRVAVQKWQLCLQGSDTRDKPWLGCALTMHFMAEPS
jgi:hypothetical protein